jgi:hypothetical protein
VRSVAQYSIFEPAPLSFVVLPVVLVGVLAWGTAVAWRRSGAPISAAARAAAVSVAAASAWMAGTGVVAASGVLRDWDRTPPPFAMLVAAIAAIAFGAAYSPFGSRIASNIPLWGLVLVQAFRLPLEVAMHGMYTRGVMPVQMSYTGLNVDIVTGATAILVALLAATGRAGPRLIAAWNVVGLGLLVNVVTVAILATPRFRYFGDDHLNIWVTYPPFVWLPAVMVLAALAGHLLIFRGLSRQKDAVRR